MEKKKGLWISGGLIAAVIAAVVGVTVKGGDGDGDDTVYKVIVDLSATGDGSVSVNISDVVDASFAIVGTTTDEIQASLPASVGKRLHEQHSSGALRGVKLADVKGDGDVAGELKVTVSTPFGELTVYDKPFKYGQPDTTQKK